MASIAIMWRHAARFRVLIRDGDICIAAHDWPNEKEANASLPPRLYRKLYDADDPHEQTTIEEYDRTFDSFRLYTTEKSLHEACFRFMRKQGINGGYGCEVFADDTARRRKEIQRETVAVFRAFGLNLAYEDSDLSLREFTHCANSQGALSARAITLLEDYCSQLDALDGREHDAILLKYAIIQQELKDERLRNIFEGRFPDGTDPNADN